MAQTGAFYRVSGGDAGQGRKTFNQRVSGDMHVSGLPMRAIVNKDKLRPMSRLVQAIPDAYEGESAFNARGLFSAVARRAGDVLCHLGGEVIPHGDDLAMLAQAEWNALDDQRILLRRVPTNYYLINHSAAPNLTINPHTHALSARVDIAKGDELLLDYLENGFPQAYLRSDRCAYLR